MSGRICGRPVSAPPRHEIKHEGSTKAISCFLTPCTWTVLPTIHHEQSSLSMSFLSIIINRLVEGIRSALTLPYTWFMHNADLAIRLQDTMSFTKQYQLDDAQLSKSISDNALSTLQSTEQVKSSVSGDSTQPNANSNEVANNLTSNESTITFMSLPDLVKRRILEYLLDEEEVVETATDNNDVLVKHNFHTAIMRTNKDTYDLAKEVFHGNHFVVVSVTPSDVLDWFVKRKLSFWKNNLKYFRGYHLRAHIICHTHQNAQPKLKGQPRQHAFLIVTLRSLDHLTHILRAHELAEHEAFKLNLELKRGNPGAMLSTKIQARLLEPFRRLHPDKCNVYGEVDLDLADAVMSATTATIKWIRASAWSCYDTALYLKHLGDAAYLSDKYSTAIDCYEAVSEFIEIVNSYDNYNDVPDVNYHRNLNILGYAVGLSWAQVLVHTLVSDFDVDRLLPEIALRAKRLRILGGIQELQYSTPGLFDKPGPSKIQFQLMVAIAEFSLGNMDEEGLASITQGDEALAKAAPAHDASLAARFSCAKAMGETWRDTDNDKKTNDQRNNFLRRLDKLVPHWPYESEYIEGCACKYKSELLAQEVYIIKALGYKRDPREARIDLDYFNTFEDPVEGAVTDFDREEANMQIQERKKDMEVALRRRGSRMRYTMECILDPSTPQSGWHQHLDRRDFRDGSDEESGSEGSGEGTEGDEEWEDEEE